MARKLTSTMMKSTIIALHNPKTPSNVGAVMRAAGCYQADAVRYSGERLDRAMKFQTDTNNVKNKVPLTHVDELLDKVPNDVKVVCIELVEGATTLSEFEHPQQAMYVFGPEDGSIPQYMIDQADAAVYIPTIGCMNLAATVNVVLYDRLSKMDDRIDHKERIRNSRDTNNRLVLKSGS